MKKITSVKSLVALLFLAALVTLALPQSVRADVGTIDFGLTNSVAATTTNTGVAYSTNIVSIDNVDNVGLMFTGWGAGSGTSNLKLTFYPVPDGSTPCTNTTFDWFIPAVGATNVNAYTNIPSSLVGSSGSIGVYAFGNANAAGITNCRLIAIKKKLR